MSSTDRALLRVRAHSAPRRGSRGGFVLLEAVVALAIIGIFAVGLLAATGSQLRASNKQGVLLVARSLAEDRMMALRLLDYEALSDIPDSLRRGRFPAPFEEYEWTAAVTPVKDEYDLFDAEVLVTIGHEGYPLRTLLHEPRPAAQSGGL